MNEAVRISERAEQGEILALRKALDAATEEIARLERVVVELQRTELSTQTELAKAISGLETARRLDSGEADRLEAELEAAHDRVAQYRGALVSVLESRSWKLTRPLRRARGSNRPDRELLEELGPSG